MSPRKDDREKIAKRYQNEEQMEKTFKWKPGFQRNHSNARDRKHPDKWLTPPNDGMQVGDEKELSPGKDGNYIRTKEAGPKDDSYLVDKVLDGIDVDVDTARNLFLGWYRTGFFDIKAIRRVCDIKKSAYDDDSLHRTLRQYSERYGHPVITLDDINEVMYHVEVVAGRFGDAYLGILSAKDEVMLNKIYYER